MVRFNESNQKEIVLEINELFQNLSPGKYVLKVHINIISDDTIKKNFHLCLNLQSSETHKIILSKEILKFLSSEDNWLKLATGGIVSSSLRWFRQKLKSSCCRSSADGYQIEADQTKKGWFFITLPCFKVVSSKADNGSTNMTENEVNKVNIELYSSGRSVLLSNLQNLLYDEGVNVDLVVLEKQETGDILDNYNFRPKLNTQKKTVKI